MQVIKRDGRVVAWDSAKIIAAMRKAFAAEGASVSDDTLEALTIRVIKRCQSQEDVHIETIQDVVEQVLMERHPQVAKAYIIYRQRRSEMRGVPIDVNAIAGYIHASKYARFRPDLHRRETFEETVDRVEAMHTERFPHLASKIHDAFDMVRAKKFLPSMRSMQFAGEAMEQHHARMYNCSYTLVDRPRVFAEILYLLLCGCGVGFSVQKQHVAKLPRLKKIDPAKVAHYRIPDNIEGWAEALNKLVMSYVEGFYVEFSYVDIRPVGSPLGSGGRAPGHFPLKRALEQIRTILHAAQGRQLRPIEAYDIICHSADAVLSGGIRRSSSIALFSYDDDEMRCSKEPANFDFVSKNPQRALANNSVALLRTDVTREQFMSIMDQNRESYGEPGFVFLDDLDHGTNPCGEIGIDPTLDGETGFGFCNLVEINAAGVKDSHEFYRVCEMASLIATLQASYTNFRYLTSVSRRIAERDALIGVGLTGLMDNPWIFQDRILKHGADIVIISNQETANAIGINHARRCTCVKPSGTASLELGCVGSGIHPHHSKRYFRRVTANPHEHVAQYFRKVNPHMVEVKPNGDWCITFPVQTEGRTYDNLTQDEFLEKIIQVVEEWIRPGHIHGPSHNVSSTMVVTDWNILDRVWEQRDSITSMTFLPAMSDKSIPFCPREAVINDKDMTLWNHILRHYRPVDYSKMEELTDDTSLQREAACSGGSCEISSHVDVPEGVRIFFGPHNIGEMIGRYTITEVYTEYAIGVWK